MAIVKDGNNGEADASGAVSPRVGLLGELEVELRLVKSGWHPVRLDTAQMASNADLLAINREKRVSIQVKTTNAERRHSHSEYLGFGYSTGYIRDDKPIFNSKPSPLIADVVVAVSYRGAASRFVVLPVAFAEKLCRLHAEYWSKVPARKRESGLSGKRSDSFPLYLCFSASPDSAHKLHHERIKRNLLAYENKWEVLLEPTERLHKQAAWGLLQ